jgi:hypothetical protein
MAAIVKEKIRVLTLEETKSIFGSEEVPESELGPDKSLHSQLLRALTILSDKTDRVITSIESERSKRSAK